MKFTGKNSEYIELVNINESNVNLLHQARPSELSLLWFKGENNSINIDSVNYHFENNDIISLTEFHKIKVENLEKAILLRWNRDFYCVVDHDSEVSCKGILYYGASTVPLIKPDDQNVEIFTALLKVLQIEMNSKDNLQLEMLQMMLKRLLILCTRIYKEQNIEGHLQPKSIDIIREYNFLVEQHFKTKHSVKEYADLLFKSPKTLSNLFKKSGNSTPQQFIQDRIILESRRLLIYSDKTVSDISFELGFSNIQTFSRFFTKQEGISPKHFRSREILPTI